MQSKNELKKYRQHNEIDKKTIPESIDGYLKSMAHSGSLYRSLGKKEIIKKKKLKNSNAFDRSFLLTVSNDDSE